MSIKIGRMKDSISIGEDGIIFLLFKYLRIFFLLNCTLNFAIYLLFTKISSLIEKFSIKLFLSFKEIMLIFNLSLFSMSLYNKILKACSNALSTTFDLSKFIS